MTIPDPTERPTLAVEEAGAILGISRSAAYDSARRGELPTLRFGRRLLVPTAAFRQLLGIDVPDDAGLNGRTPLAGGSTCSIAETTARTSTTGAKHDQPT